MKNFLSKRAKRFGIGLLLTGGLFIGFAHCYIRFRIAGMPGTSQEETPSIMSETITGIANRLRADVEYLANEIGGRSIYNAGQLNEAREWISGRFQALGLDLMVQSYQISPAEISKAIASRNRRLKDYGRTDFLPAYRHSKSQEVANLWVAFKGRDNPDKTIVVGAHYDSVGPDCPGADDNASGIAGLLEIAGHLKKKPPALSVLLVAFTCEEYPIGGIEKMGSSVFVKQLTEQTDNRIMGMISLEMLGYYSNLPGSQKYPAPFSFYFPDTANFIGFVGDSTSRTFIRSVVHQFRQIPAMIPSRGVAAPVWLAPDVLRSDHEPFVGNGIPGLMITDTSNFRYGEHLHQTTDTPDKLDFTRMAYLVDGLSRMIENFEY